MDRIVFTCEHAGAKIPTPLKSTLAIPSTVLKSHRGSDFGALRVAKKLAQDLNAPLFFQETTRLVLDYNRSLHNPRIWSSYSKGLPEKQKKMLIQEYQEYRTQVAKTIQQKSEHCV